MARFDLRTWLADRSVLAARLTDQDGEGFFRKRFHVPAQTVALVTPVGAKPHVAYAGEELSGKYDAVLIKQGEAAIEYRLEGLLARDEMPVTVDLMFFIQVESDEDTYVRDFCKSIFSTGNQFSTNDIKSYLGFDVRKVMGAFVARHDVAGLLRSQILTEAEEALRGELERTLFGKGLGFRKIGKFEASSRQYDRVRQDRARAQEKIERHEKDLEEVDRRGEKIRRLLEMARAEDMQKLLESVKDEKVRGIVYAKLMGPDLRSLSVLEMQERLSDVDDDLLGVLLRALTTGMDGGSAHLGDGMPATKSAQIYVVAGLTVMAFDPGHPEKRGEYKFAEPLRSVRLEEAPAGKSNDGRPTRLLAGGKATCFVMDGESKAITEYPLPRGKRPRGGINSAAVWGDELFATHSEFGLARWRLDHPGDRAEIMFEELTQAHKTTRSVMVSRTGVLFFASGSHLYSVDLNQRRLTPVAWKPALQGSITSIDVCGDVVAAAGGDDASGSVVAWNLDHPESGTVLVRKKEAVLGVHLTRINGMAQVLFVTRDHGVIARVLGQSLETVYQSGEHALGLVDGASDFICGVDTPGRRLFFWNAANPQKPASTIEMVRFAEHPVYDLKVLTIPEA